MTPSEMTQAYIDGWNAHDTDRIKACFAGGGTYSDPTIGDGISTEALAGYVDALVAAFPDLRFEVVKMIDAGENTAIAEWIMKGTNSGSLRGLPPSGREIALPGVDIVDVSGDGITSVRGYFNGGTMLEQLDLLVTVLPKAIGPTRFGNSNYTSLGSKAKPGVIGVTQIQLTSMDRVDELRNLTRAILQEIAGMPGFISSTTAGVANGHAVTLTAWEDLQSAKAAVQGEAHRKAIDAFFAKDGLAASAWTSLWTDGQLNTRWQRCDACGSMAAVTSGLSCKCGAGIEEPAWF